MSLVRSLSDPERWHWFAAGDGAAAPHVRARATGNAPAQVVFEMGLVFAVPLALAALATLVFGT